LNFSANLQNILNQKSLKQADLARMTNTNNTSISKYINGTSIPSVDFLFKAAEALNVSCDLLVFGLEKEKIPEDMIYIIELLKKLDDRELIKMEVFIENEFEKILSRRVTSPGLNNTG